MLPQSFKILNKTAFKNRLKEFAFEFMYFNRPNVEEFITHSVAGEVE